MTAPSRRCWTELSVSQRRVVLRDHVASGRHWCELRLHWDAPLASLSNLRRVMIADGSLPRPDPDEATPAPPGPGVRLVDRGSRECAWPLWPDYEDPGEAPVCGARTYGKASLCPVCEARALGGWGYIPGLRRTSRAEMMIKTAF